MSVIAYGIHHEVFPPLIFLGVGAMTDFGPLLANPKTLLLGAAAQGGVFVALLGAMLLGFSVQEAAAIGIIGGADGPTSIYLAAKMAPQLLGAIAVAAYSYMSLVPLIQPPIMMLCTTEHDRKIVMKQLRPVSHFEKIAFPIMCTIVISLLLPSVTALIGMLMLGNLFGMLLAVPVFVYTVIGITCLFASFLDMPERAGHVIVFTSIPLFFLSGAAWPHAAMPIWMQVIAEILPSTQMVQMFIQLNQMGVPTALILPKLIYLGLIGSLCFFLAYRRFIQVSQSR